MIYVEKPLYSFKHISTVAAQLISWFVEQWSH
ncbi:hypothetical protein T03_4403 [Trichinella britovi]|uniref:Uncharacterized protein n=1 Tax=Trichinella britovi TaxID=45882 RepID=A0A0V0YPK6_TRIBR|nr:hypothetical protein T03_4403 [Trichinella britovi]